MELNKTSAFKELKYQVSFIIKHNFFGTGGSDYYIEIAKPSLDPGIS